MEKLYDIKNEVFFNTQREDTLGCKVKQARLRTLRFMLL